MIKTILNSDTGELKLELNSVSACLYPYYNKQLNPDHPYNIYLNIEGQTFNAKTYELLYQELIKSAEDQIKKYGQYPGKWYFNSKPSDHCFKWFKNKNLLEGVGLYRMVNPSIQINAVALNIEVVTRYDLKTQNIFLEAFEHAFSERKTKAWLKECLDQGMILYVAKEKQNIVGAGLIQMKDKIGFIDTLFVNEKFRGKGYGQKLINFAHIYFKKHGINQVELEVWGPNIHAINFYKALGYETKEIITHTFGKIIKALKD